MVDDDERETEIEIDGSAGGGQLLRTALSLSCLDEVSLRMTSIRGSRPSPGLKPQHLACVEAAAALCDADVEGADEGSETLVFEPTAPPAGDVAIDVGTAGSVALVFDTVLPLATALSEPVAVTAVGGTDVKWAPPVESYRRVKLPLLARAGLAADVSLFRRGFYPVGGGRATLHLAPSALRPLALRRRGDLAANAAAVAATDLADARVCERALDRVRESLGNAVELTETTATYAEADCPGFALSVALVGDGDARAGFDAIGERGVPAEEVADDVCDQVGAWVDGEGVVDPRLADQLLVPLALAGGRVRLPAVTEHVRTNLEVVDAFGYDVALSESDEYATVSATPSS